METWTLLELYPEDFWDGKACASNWQSRLKHSAVIAVEQSAFVLINNRIVKNRPTGKIGRIKSPSKKQ